MVETMTAPEERYAPPPVQPRKTLGDHVERLLPQLRATPARAAAATLVIALVIICVVALQPVQASGADDTGAFKADCGVSIYLFGHPSPGVQQVCRDAYTGHAIALFAAAGGLLAAFTALVILLLRPVPPASPERTRGWRAYVANPARASAVTAMVVLVFVALFSLLPAHAQDDSDRGAFSAQCGLSIFVFGHHDPAVQHACNDAYGTRGRTFFASVAAVAIIGVAVAASVHNARRRATVDDAVAPDTGRADPP